MILSGQNKELSPAQKEFKQRRVEEAYANFLDALGYDWENDPNMKGTPKRVAKMYMNETTQGSYDPKPKITSFPNQGDYQGMVMQGGVDVKSLCSHHMMPFYGKAYVAYIPGEKVIGLSKINRIVDYYARRPQLQEQLTKQIHDEISEIMVGNKGVAVYIEANHTCVSMRGVNQESFMKTAQLSGEFKKEQSSARSEFYSMIK